MTPELVELEAHNTGYGGKGTLSHVVFPTSVASIPQACGDLIVAVSLARLEMG